MSDSSKSVENQDFCPFLWDARRGYSLLCCETILRQAVFLVGVTLVYRFMHLFVGKRHVVFDETTRCFW